MFNILFTRSTPQALKLRAALIAQAASGKVSSAVKAAAYYQMHTSSRQRAGTQVAPHPFTIVTK